MGGIQGEPATVAQALASAGAGTLVGRKCASCGRVSFTDPLVCRQCKGTDLVPFTSSGEGEVVTFTIIAFPAEPFADQAPYAFVIARMAEGAMACGWVPHVKDPRQLPPGTKLRAVPSPGGRGLCFEIA